MLHFHIISLFPDSIEPYLKSSILGRAREGIAPKGKKGGKALIKVSYYDPKDFTDGKQDRVDRRPYGGGPGMVLQPEAILRAVDAAKKKSKGKPEILIFGTDGKVFDEADAKKYSKKKDIIMICGRYEGVDARVQKILKAKVVSVGPYVLTGGELPAATLVDAISRFVPGVLGKAESLEASRVSAPEVYTRPEILTWKGKKHRVPEVLTSGNHADIDVWKRSVTAKKS
jgi:tRNA (guanine37-N1)-methyltransferase